MWFSKIERRNRLTQKLAGKKARLAALAFYLRDDGAPLYLVDQYLGLIEEIAVLEEKVERASQAK